MNQTAPQPIFYVFYVSLIVALGGFLMGFDASVISGVVKFIEVEFQLSKIELGWAVASLSLTATLAMMTAGPLSDKYGRKPILKLAASLFLVSAILSAIAPSFIMLVIARMLGGLGVGAALIIAPMYIAEIVSAQYRGRMVSLNQLNIVVGISVAFITNYWILSLAESPAAWVGTLNLSSWNWRWMLGIEAIPALLYLISLNFVPESPRWLILKSRMQEAQIVLNKAMGELAAASEISAIQDSLNKPEQANKSSITALLHPSMRLVMILGISIAVLQQITGINAVFFYAPMIFEQSGFGTDASFAQAIFVGLTNLVFTLIAISLIDKIGRKSLLVFGVSGVVLCMFSLSFLFSEATYTLSAQALTDIDNNINLTALIGVTFNDELAFKQAIIQAVGMDVAASIESTLLSQAININGTLVLACILGFVACFAVSLGPVMWVLFSELFPNKIRGIAISFVGLCNSAVSFLVQLLFPWELAKLGSTLTFAIYGSFALIGLVIIIKLLPETKGKSLEDLERELIK